MKAIVTKYHGPTNTRGSRITASDGDGNRVSIGYPHHLSGSACHDEAARELCRKMKWTGRLVSGQIKPGEHVYVWVRPSDVGIDV